MIRSGLILMIKDLAGKGKSAYAIGQEIGISKNTARKSRKYMEQADQQHGLKGISKGLFGSGETNLQVSVSASRDPVLDNRKRDRLKPVP